VRPELTLEQAVEIISAMRSRARLAEDAGLACQAANMRSCVAAVRDALDAAIAAASVPDTDNASAEARCMLTANPEYAAEAHGK
jgi:hypothetical protein